MREYRVRPDLGDVFYSGQQPRDAADIMRPRLEPVRQVIRHGLGDTVRTRTAAHQRQGVRAAQQYARSLRAEQPLMPRHGDERRAQPREVHVQHSRRLRRVYYQRHASPAAQRRDLIDRQDIAKDV